MPVKAPPPAQTPPSSTKIGLYLGETWSRLDFDGPISNDRAFLYGGTARANIWWNPNWSTQFDLEGDGASKFKNAADGDRRSSVGGGVHLDWRDPRTGALGVFGGILEANNLDDNGSMRHSLVGVEGQAYFNNATLYGQLGYLNRMSGSDELEPDHMWFVRGVGRYFFTPNDKFQAEIGYAKGPSFDCGSACSDIHLANWGALYEHKYNGSPISVFAEYAGFNYSGSEFGEHFKATEHMFMLGAKVYFGQGTLLANDRTGTTFDMPKFIRALPWAELAGP